jgi:hypothetical protein
MTRQQHPVPRRRDVRHFLDRVSQGVGHTVVDGVVRAVFPAGRTVEDFFVQKVE